MGVIARRFHFQDGRTRLTDASVVFIVQRDHAVAMRQIKLSIWREGEVHRMMQVVRENGNQFAAAIRRLEHFDTVMFRAGIICGRKVGVRF